MVAIYAELLINVLPADIWLESELALCLYRHMNIAYSNLAVDVYVDSVCVYLKKHANFKKQS